MAVSIVVGSWRVYVEGHDDGYTVVLSLGDSHYAGYGATLRGAVSDAADTAREWGHTVSVDAVTRRLRQLGFDDDEGVVVQ